MNKTYKIGSATAIAIAYAASMEINPTQSKTIATIALVGGNGSLALGADAKPQVGDELVLKVSSDGTARNLTFGTGFTAPTLSGTINKTKTQTLVYDGTSFIASSSPVQID